MHAAAGEGHDRADRIHLAGVDGVGGAELARELQLGCHRVDGDDAAGTGDGGAVDAREPDTAAADYGNGFRRARTLAV